MVQTAPGQRARVPRTGLCLVPQLVIAGAARAGRPAVRGRAADGQVAGRDETANSSPRTSSRGDRAGPFTQRHHAAGARATALEGGSAVRTSGHASGQYSQSTHLWRSGHDEGHYRRAGARPVTRPERNVR
jgi:hypothetical protein